MGRTEADRKITSEPWPSMQRRKKTEKNEREKLFSVTRGSVLKKSLTEPTLLEMSGNRTSAPRCLRDVRTRWSTRHDYRRLLRIRRITSARSTRHNALKSNLSKGGNSRGS